MHYYDKEKTIPFVIPHDAHSGFAWRRKQKKSFGKKFISFLSLFILMLAPIAVLEFQYLNYGKSQDNNLAMVSSSFLKNNLSLSFNEPKLILPDPMLRGIYCNQNSQASITGLVGETSSCNLEPKIMEGKYVDIILSKMLVLLYEDGILVKEYKISAKGNPNSLNPAGRTPSGSFSVLSKKLKAFSSLSYVWMPYAVNFSGPYFLHGIPYYTDGQLVDGQYSGGCLRIETEQMKEIYDFVDIGTPIILHE